MNPSFFTDLQKRYNLSEASISLLVQTMQKNTYKKKDVIIEQGMNDRFNYFVANGLVRGYLTKGVKTYTASFDFEGQLIGSLPGLTGEQRSQLSYEAIEDTTLYKISKQSLEDIFYSSIEFANWGRKLVEEKIKYSDYYFIHYYTEEKSVQYQKFLTDYPELIQRVAIKDLATYLNVTPQSLSRIRAL
jgi:CRP-like cAMP-binding protein